MKINKFLISAGVITSMLMASCVGDLDLQPTDPNSDTPDKFKNDPERYLDEAIAGVYLQYAAQGANNMTTVSGFDPGMSTFQRAAFILEEIPTDEASWIATQDADYGLFEYGILDASNQAILGTYSRFLINVALCDQFIQTVNDGYFNLESVPGLQEKADEYIRQAKILRAAAYWYAIDCFGNVPWADEYVTMGSVAPQLSTNFAEGRAAVYQQNVESLEELVAWYKENDPNNIPVYGYVGLDVAEALLVKYYLNAEVYSGKANWQACYNHAQAIIDRRGNGGFNNTGLCNSYFQNFSANSKDYVIGGAAGVNEIIWTIPQQLVTDGVGLISWANSTFMINAWISGDIQNVYNAGDGWKCIVTRPQFVEKFQWTDANYSVSPDLRTDWWMTSKDGFALQNVDLTQANYGNNGYLAVKFTNWVINDDGSVNEAASPKNPGSQVGGDYPMLRLAEIYLSGAEAAYNMGNISQAREWVNIIRARAKMPTYNSDTEMSIAELRDERCRELYTECTRRSDLIRYNQWISNYNWSWKNYTPNGTDFNSNFIVYPLPLSTVSRNGYTQNPGY